MPSKDEHVFFLIWSINRTKPLEKEQIYFEKSCFENLQKRNHVTNERAKREQVASIEARPRLRSLSQVPGPGISS